MKCYLEVFFEISSLRWTVEVQNVIVGAMLRQKKKIWSDMRRFGSI